MSATDWMVVVAGLGVIAWVNWYFFLSKRPVAMATAGAGGAQEITITVQGGYEPAEVKVKRGVPVRLIFDRQETSSCSEEVVIPDFGTLQGPFQVAALEYAGAFDGEATFALTLASAGAVSFTPA